MTTTVTIIFDNPLDPVAFETSYADQLALARSSVSGSCGCSAGLDQR
jgi:hypothetical protein